MESVDTITLQGRLKAAIALTKRGKNESATALFEQVINEITQLQVELKSKNDYIKQEENLSFIFERKYDLLKNENKKMKKEINTFRSGIKACIDKIDVYFGEIQLNKK